MNVSVTILAILIGKLALARGPNDSPAVTNWGKAVADVQLSVSLTTNVVEAGLPAIAQAHIRNSSTNDVFIFHNGALPHDFGVFLIDESGKSIDLTPKVQHPSVGWGSLHINIKPGTVRDSEVRIILSSGMVSGKYKLELS